MKQGTGKTVSAPKVEPKVKGISAGSVADIGISTHYKKPNLHEGRGFKAPKDDGNCRLPAGTQGKH